MCFIAVAQWERYRDAKVMYSLHVHRGDDVVEAELAEMCDRLGWELGPTKWKTSRSSSHGNRYARNLRLYAVMGQIIDVFFTTDHWTRRKTVISGSYTLAVVLADLTALSYFYADGVN
ncbi:hypothetical protein O1611_g3442 [Lasiodiplodia mahajangana]|uniref:Uncharacterized protein n=1 Tax=Lasiodiplodia mahajangana TaxID=1108764 RepID=A0ACC2JRS8_9PEZI|nr:hypothetical protein O1611_g3442 [Lasiodiplodia mahajangana]